MSPDPRPPKTVAIVQSNYVPWKGYFDLIGLVDEFVIYDTMQYTKRDWRNRNVIKAAGGPMWLTIPVETKGRFRQRIDETVVSDPSWAERHWKTLQSSYARAPCFNSVHPEIEALYRAPQPDHLSDINRRFIEALCRMLGITTRITSSADYNCSGQRSERLLNICTAAGATSYLSGPSARAYLDVDLFAKAGVGVEFMDYAGYDEYPQPHPPFKHEVSVLDLIFCTGANARRYLKCFERTAALP